MNRDDYLMQAHQFALRGSDLPQTKITDADVTTIREAVEKREDLLAHIRENLSNAALAKKLGVHVRTIERITSYNGWRHVKDTIGIGE